MLHKAFLDLGWVKFFTSSPICRFMMGLEDHCEKNLFNVTVFWGKLYRVLIFGAPFFKIPILLLLTISGRIQALISISLRGGDKDVDAALLPQCAS